MTVFKKFVELGRVVHVTKGADKGKLGAIVDVIDANRLLIHGPKIKRQEMKLRDCYLTKIKLRVHHTMSKPQFHQMWKNSIVESRFAKSVYAQRLQQHETRKNITDFGYFKVRTAQRTCSKIVNSSYKSLRSNNPCTLLKLEKHRRHVMAVKLGFKRLRKMPVEKKTKLAARKIIKLENRKVKCNERYAEKKALRAKRRETRKARVEKLAAAGKLKPREFVPKEKRVCQPKGKSSEPNVSSIKLMRRERDYTRKANKETNRTTSKAFLVYKEACKSAVADNKPVPKQFKLKFAAKAKHGDVKAKKRNIKRNADHKAKRVEAKKA